MWAVLREVYLCFPLPQQCYGIPVEGGWNLSTTLVATLLLPPRRVGGAQASASSLPLAACVQSLIALGVALHTPM